MASRRSPGEGNVTWDNRRQAAIARITIGYNAAGNPARVSRSFSAAQHGSQERALIAARTWLGEQVAQRNRGILIDPSKETLASWIEDFLAASVARVSPKTLFGYRYYLEEVVVPALGRVRLRDITPRMVQTWVARESKTRPAYTVWRAHKYLSQVLNHAERLELIARNPASKITVAKPTRTTLSRWSPSEARQALAWCREHDPYLGAYIHLALVTGMRREELLGLRWSAVQILHSNPHIEVREVCIYVKSKPQFGPTKTKQPRRVYLDAGTVRVLEEHRTRVALIRSKRESWVDHDLVYPSLRGGPLSESSFARRFAKACTESGAGRIRLYDLRSTYVSLTEGKLSETVAADRAGHSEQIRRTHYLRAVDEQRIAAALTLEELLG